MASLTEALNLHTLTEVLELNFILDRNDDMLADQDDAIGKMLLLALWNAGGFRY